MDAPAGIQVLFEDESFLVINKPAGISTLPDGYDPSLPHIKSLLEQQYSRLWIVHRLDKETSGVLLLARTAAAHRALNTQFEQRLVKKSYHALVSGVPGWQEKTVDLPLRPNGDRRHRTVIDKEHGKPAITHFKLLERYTLHCLMEAIPETGRTHQIRAHLLAVGLSIVGDKLYSRDPNALGGQAGGNPPPFHDPLSEMAAGMALHAYVIEIDHPLTGEKMKVTAPYPPAMAALLQYLRRQQNS